MSAGRFIVTLVVLVLVSEPPLHVRFTVTFGAAAICCCR